MISHPLPSLGWSLFIVHEMLYNSRVPSSLRNNSVVKRHGRKVRCNATGRLPSRLPYLSILMLMRNIGKRLRGKRSLESDPETSLSENLFQKGFRKVARRLTH